MVEARLSMAQTIRFLESKQGFSLPAGNHTVMVEKAQNERLSKVGA
jgi:hypothetical protein